MRFHCQTYVRAARSAERCFLHKIFPIRSTASLIVVSLNIQSLHLKTVDILSDNVLRATNLLLLSETWYADNQSDPSLSPHFTSVSHLKSGRGLGSSAFKDHELKVHAVSFQDFQNFTSFNTAFQSFMFTGTLGAIRKISSSR